MAHPADRCAVIQWLRVRFPPPALTERLAIHRKPLLFIEMRQF
jgi:hypothetical protein